MISIIMPIYNGEKYIDNSISRILHAGKELDLELILVNDGSIDGSLNICYKYARQNDRVKVIDKSNGGICSARNAGLDVAIGEYISFCDQDDEIFDDIYDVFSKVIKETPCDLIIAGKEFLLIDEENKVIENKFYRYEKRMYSNEKDIVGLILNVYRNAPLLHLWNCFYRKNIIKENNIRFDENFKFGMEDSMFNIEYALHCRNIVTVSELVYRYFQRKNISTSTKRNKNVVDDYQYYINKMFCLFQKSYEEAYLSDVYCYCLRFAIKIYSDTCMISYLPQKSMIWKDVYERLKRHPAERILCKPQTPFYIFIWFVWLMSDMKLYNIVANILGIIKKFR